MKKWIIVTLVIGIILGLLWKFGAPGEHRFSRHVVLSEHKYIIINWQADREDVDKALKLWEELKQ